MARYCSVSLVPPSQHSLLWLVCCSLYLHALTRAYLQAVNETRRITNITLICDPIAGIGTPQPHPDGIEHEPCALNFVWCAPSRALIWELRHDERDQMVLTVFIVPSENLSQVFRLRLSHLHGKRLRLAVHLLREWLP
jgi:hypothetical protein